MSVEFHPLDLRKASEVEYRGLNQFKNRLQAESSPDDPPTQLAEHIQEWTTIPGFVEVEAYCLHTTDRNEVLAYCEVSASHSGDNAHIADFTIEVLPEYRRQRIASQALPLIISFANARQRTVLNSRTIDRVPTGEIFLARLGARRGLTLQMAQLDLIDFDRTLLDNWRTPGVQNLANFEMRFFSGACPAAIIEMIARLREKMLNDQPREDLAIEDTQVTPDLLREIEQSLFAAGNERWTIYLIERASGHAVGLTEMMWNRNRPAIVGQGFTGISPAYRAQGLGRWLKAEMLYRILNGHPEGRFVRTGTAGTNAPMLRINNALGFQPYVSNTIWQMETEKVEKYLSKEKI